MSLTDPDFVLFAISIVLSVLFPSMLAAAVVAQEELDAEQRENAKRPVVTFVGSSYE